MYTQYAPLAHLGLHVLKASPELKAKSISAKTGVEDIAAYDGMKLELEERV